MLLNMVMEMVLLSLAALVLIIMGPRTTLTMRLPVISRSLLAILLAKRQPLFGFLVAMRPVSSMFKIYAIGKVRQRLQ
ncbi:hypothetical protein V1517DRAFT_330855 [Lipomyces orientalis]|uniref:Uncharacterized protein n=1 Tax=Lipomyces orientalis TaxID=1233043 RepID=A0ACC3TFL2_9ASCO